LRLSQDKSRSSIVAETGYVLASVLPFLMPSECNADERGRGTSMILNFVGKWNKWYRVLRYSKGFGPFDSVRYALWVARG